MEAPDYDVRGLRFVVSRPPYVDWLGPHDAPMVLGDVLVGCGQRADGFEYLTGTPMPTLHFETFVAGLIHSIPFAYVERLEDVPPDDELTRMVAALLTD